MILYKQGIYADCVSIAQSKAICLPDAAMDAHLIGVKVFPKVVDSVKSHLCRNVKA